MTANNPLSTAAKITLVDDEDETAELESSSSDWSSLAAAAAATLWISIAKKQTLKVTQIIYLLTKLTTISTQITS